MVTVYSLKNNLWTQAKTVSKEIPLTAKRGIYANGSLYWLATKELPIIFAFDLGVERHRELPFPTYKNENDQIGGMGMISFNNCLRIIDHYSDCRTDNWLMNDNGVENYWSMVLSVEQGPNRSLKIVWYDHAKNEVKNVTVQGVPRPFDMLVYTESLVQLGHDFELDRKKLLKQSKEKKKRQQKNNKMSGNLSKGSQSKLEDYGFKKRKE
ncbi:hypothetical protein AgCh_036959 [Apium graveolens]